MEIEYEIILLLLREKTHLRNIAKELNLSPSTLMRKINILVELGVLNFKIEGKNKLFYIENNLIARSYVLNAENYKLRKFAEKYPKVALVLSEVIKKTDCMTLLFGSYSKFCADKNSDIDIYVDTVDTKIKNVLESINSKINVKIGKFDKSSFLIKEIINNHIILRGGEIFYEKILN